MAETVTRFGPPTTLVNNAGTNVFHEPLAMSDAEWQRCFRLDLDSALTCSKAVLPLMQPMDMASENHQRLPRRPVQQPADPGDDPRAAFARLRELAEAEDAFGAEALLRGAIERGWGREVIEPWLFRLCTDHFLDFGHALIYQIKIFDLLDRGFDPDGAITEIRPCAPVARV